MADYNPFAKILTNVNNRCEVACEALELLRYSSPQDYIPKKMQLDILFMRIVRLEDSLRNLGKGVDILAKMRMAETAALEIVTDIENLKLT